MGTIITFYSYKGGVGRSMAVANVGVLLAQWGYRVLCVDFDLEAPGLESFFQSFVDLSDTRKNRGLIDFLCEYFENQTTVSAYAVDSVPIPLPRTSGRIALWTSGMRDEDYFKRVRRLDFPKMYSDMNGGALIEELRNELKKAFDFVLIDSRTGLTDIGGVCTVQLPDTIVLLFTPTDQAFEGGIDIIRRSLIARQRLPFSRPVIPTLPIPSRFDTQAEFRISQIWLDRFAKDLQDFYSDWLPKSVDRRDLLELTKLPHVPFFSFGESLPVIEQGTADPGGLGYAYANLAALTAKNLQDIEVFMEARDKYVRSAARQQMKPGKRSSYARIFISYHPKDSRWVKLLEIILRPYVKSRNMLIGYHELPEAPEAPFHYIRPGSMWEEETQTQMQRTMQGHLRAMYRNYLGKLASSTVAVLLVSPEYLASDFISGEELPMLLRAVRERGLRITWIAVQPSLVEETRINSFQAAYDPSKPLSELDEADLNRALVEIAKRISEIAGRAY